MDIVYMTALCKRIILWYASLHDFNMLYKTVPQFNVKSIIHFNEEKGFQGIRTIKNLSLKTEEATSNVLRSLRKKKNNMSEKSYIPTRRIYLQNLPPILTL